MVKRLVVLDLFRCRALADGLFSDAAASGDIQWSKVMSKMLAGLSKSCLWNSRGDSELSRVDEGLRIPHLTL